MGILNKFANLSEWIESENRHMFYCHFCEKWMIAHAALALKDAFTPQFASIQGILDSVDFFLNYEGILPKFASSCCYMLLFSFFFLLCLYSVKWELYIYKHHQSSFVPNPGRLFNICEQYHKKALKHIFWGSKSSNPGVAASISDIGYFLLPSRHMTERLLKRCKILKTTHPLTKLVYGTKVNHFVNLRSMINTRIPSGFFQIENR